MTSVKCHHCHTSSTSSGSTPHPPQKKHVATHASPNCNWIKESLQSRGAYEFDAKKGRLTFHMEFKVTKYLCISVFWQKIIQVDFYPIPVRDFNDLVDKKVAFDIRGMEADLFSGNIRLDLSANALIGVGAFMTVQSAQLMLSPLRDLGIGSSPNHRIVLKRPFINDDPTEVGPPFAHYVLKDETNLLYHEANALYWVKALLQMTYRFIDHAIEDGRVPPPFEIPCLHFVDAGLLFAYSDVSLATAEGTGQPVKPSGTVNIAYLSEEFIPMSLDEEFVKYIHNGDAAPCILWDTEVEEIAEFLAFTQHVQYIKTGGQVYISDYQGMFAHSMVHLAHTYITRSGY